MPDIHPSGPFGRKSTNRLLRWLKAGLTLQFHPLSWSLASVTMRALFIWQPLNRQSFTHSFMLGCPLKIGDQAGEWKNLTLNDWRITWQ